MQRHQKSRAGFNLIEAAIVLGVVGMVIGGIWTAAARVSFNNKVNDIALAAVRIAAVIRTNYPVGMRSGANLDSYAGTILTRNLHAYPGSWPIDSGGYPVHPFGGQMRTQIWFGSDNFVALGIRALNRDACIALFTKMVTTVATNGDMKFVLIVDGATSATLTQYNPISGASLDQASSNCPATNGQVSAYFTL